MKNIVKLLFIFSLIYFTGCKPVTEYQENTVYGTATLYDVLNQNPQFSTFLSLANKAGLQNDLTGSTLNTFFVPTNDAFAALAASGVNVDALSVDDLKQILLYHKVAVNRRLVTQGADANTLGTTLTMSNGAVAGTRYNYPTLVIVKSATAVTSLNGFARGVVSNIVASNGVIHSIDRVLLPPSATSGSTIYDLITANPTDYSLLKLAIDRAATVNPAILTTLQGAGNLTLLAPNNAAFIAAGYTSTTIPTRGADTLNTVLLYHLRTNARVFSTGLSNGAFATSGFGLILAASGSDVFINNDATTRILGVTSRSSKNDVLASNGVIHQLNKVLIASNNNVINTPAQTITQIVTAAASAVPTPEFTLLLKALTVTGLSLTPGSIGTLSTAPNAPASIASFTVFAPTDAAFIAAGYTSAAMDVLDDAGKAKLANIIRYHVLSTSTRVFSTTASNGRQNTQLWNGLAFLPATSTTLGAATLQNSPSRINNQQVTVSVSGGVFSVKGDNNANAITVDASRRNILATDGIVHVIPTVLLPL